MNRGNTSLVIAEQLHAAQGQFMRNIIRDFIVFIRFFVRYTAYLRGVVVALMLLLALGGVLVSRFENRDLGEALYFSFITGLTIGYGDISPETSLGRITSVVIGLIGMVFSGVIVAIATRALADAARTLNAESFGDSTPVPMPKPPL